MVHTFRPMADGAGVVLDASHQPGVPATIEADPVRVAEVLSNLLTNALKHTPTGGHVSVAVTGEPHGGVTFAVEDTGPGIAPELLPFVFDRFTTSTDTDGTGLGLAIAKRLVEAHGGTIDGVLQRASGTTIRARSPHPSIVNRGATPARGIPLANPKLLRHPKRRRVPCAHSRWRRSMFPQP